MNNRISFDSCRGENCKAGKDEIVKLIPRDVMLNVAIQETVARRRRETNLSTGPSGINNATATYLWKCEVNTTDAFTFTDITYMLSSCKFPNYIFDHLKNGAYFDAGYAI